MQALRSLPPPVTAAQLAFQTGVSDRTLYRDIESLRSLGAVIEGAAGFGYTLIEDASLPPLAFDDEEIEALVLGLREVRQVGDPALRDAAQSALSKLRSRLPQRQAHRLQHAVLSAHRFSALPEPTVDPRILRRAAWDEVQISFGYRDKSGAPTQREVKPLSIVHFEASHCLLAYCTLRSDFRAFRLDRMQDLVVTNRSFRPQRIVLLRAYLDQIGMSAEARAR